MLYIVFLRITRPPNATRHYTLFSYTTLCRSLGLGLSGCGGGSNVKPASPPSSGSGNSNPANDVLVAAAGTTLKVMSGESISKRIVLEKEDRKSTRLNSSH